MLCIHILTGTIVERNTLVYSSMHTYAKTALGLNINKCTPSFGGQHFTLCSSFVSENRCTYEQWRNFNVSGFFSPVFTHLTSSFFRMTNGVKVPPLKEKEREWERKGSLSYLSGQSTFWRTLRYPHNTHTEKKLLPSGCHGNLDKWWKGFCYLALLCSRLL